MQVRVLTSITSWIYSWQSLLAGTKKKKLLINPAINIKKTSKYSYYFTRHFLITCSKYLPPLQYECLLPTFSHQNHICWPLRLLLHTLAHATKENLDLLILIYFSCDLATSTLAWASPNCLKYEVYDVLYISKGISIMAPPNVMDGERRETGLICLI